MLNTGVAFGLWEGVPSWVVGAVLWLIIVFALKTRELWERVGLILMGGGGAMNLYQRLSLGGVRDPWEMAGLGYNNLADYLIFFGLVIYGYTYFVRGRGSSRDRQTGGSDL